MSRQVQIVLSFLVALIVLTAGSTAAQPMPDRTDPVLQVAAYYDAINQRDYTTAYSYWENPPGGASLDQFIRGFATTNRVAVFAQLPVGIGVGAGNAYAQVPVLLAAQQTDGSERYYAGCITTHKVNVPEGSATEPDPNWRLNTSSIRRVTTFDLTRLTTACPDAPALYSPYDNRLSPIDLLTSYVDAIQTGDYSRAYNYWETPPNPSLEAFAQGYADTAGVSAILRLDGIFTEGAAGSSYTNLPTLLISTDTSGRVQQFTGCYVARRVNVPQGNAADPTWRLFSGNFQAVSALPSGLALLDGVCV
jgi:hypothetical protein